MAKIFEKITPEIVGRYLGTSARSVRTGMENGTLEIGHIEVTEGGVKRYIILPNKLYNATGIKLNGYEPPPVLKIDEKNINELAKEFVNNFINCCIESKIKD